MKKFFSLVLSLCMVTALVAGFSVTAGAAPYDIEVTVGQSFEWNATESSSTWLQSKGVSPDGLWKYQFYALEIGIYQDLSSVYAGGFAWSTAPGDSGIGYARVRNNGVNFHPGQTADVVKCFTCPSGGTVEVTSVLTRTSAVLDSMTGTSFAVYLDDTLVYPTDGREYLALTTTDLQTVTFTVDVAKNQRLRFHIGSIEGNIASDSTNMTNVVFYKAINDSVAGEAEEDTIVFSRITNEIVVADSDDYDSAYGGTQDVSDSVDADEDSSTAEAGDPSDRDDEDDGKNDDRDDEGDSGFSDRILLITLIAVCGLILISAIVLIVVTRKKK